MQRAVCVDLRTRRRSEWTCACGGRRVWQCLRLRPPLVCRRGCWFLRKHSSFEEEAPAKHPRLAFAQAARSSSTIEAAVDLLWTHSFSLPGGGRPQRAVRPPPHALSRTQALAADLTFHFYLFSHTHTHVFAFFLELRTHSLTLCLLERGETRPRCFKRDGASNLGDG